MELQIFGAFGTIEEGHHRILNFGVGFENVKGVDNKPAQLGRFHLTKKEAGTNAEKRIRCGRGHCQVQARGYPIAGTAGTAVFMNKVRGPIFV